MTQITNLQEWIFLFLSFLCHPLSMSGHVFFNHSSSRSIFILLMGMSTCSWRRIGNDDRSRRRIGNDGRNRRRRSGRWSIDCNDFFLNLSFYQNDGIRISIWLNCSVVSRHSVCSQENPPAQWNPPHQHVIEPLKQIKRRDIPCSWLLLYSNILLWLRRYFLWSLRKDVLFLFLLGFPLLLCRAIISQ